MIGLVLGLLFWRHKRVRKQELEEAQISTLRPYSHAEKGDEPYTTTPSTIAVKYQAPRNDDSDAERANSSATSRYLNDSNSSHFQQEIPVSIKSFGDARAGFTPRTADELEISAGGAYYPLDLESALTPIPQFKIEST